MDVGPGISDFPPESTSATRLSSARLSSPTSTSPKTQRPRSGSGDDPGWRASATAAHRSVADIGPTKLALTTPRLSATIDDRDGVDVVLAVQRLSQPGTRHRPRRPRCTPGPWPCAAHRRTHRTRPRRTRRQATARRPRRSRRGRSVPGAEKTGCVGASTDTPTAQDGTNDQGTDEHRRRRWRTDPPRQPGRANEPDRPRRSGLRGSSRSTNISLRRFDDQGMSERGRIRHADRDHSPCGQIDRLHAGDRDLTAGTEGLDRDGSLGSRGVQHDEHVGTARSVPIAMLQRFEANDERRTHDDSGRTRCRRSGG